MIETNVRSKIWPKKKGLKLKALMFLGVLGLLPFISHCGLQVGTATSPNDAAPTGSILAQGSFAPGSKVSGTVKIYVSGTSFILRLENISAPSESSLLVRINGTPPGGPIQSFSLRATSGNQNYTFTGASNVRLNSVDIYSNANSTAYGTAILTYTSSSSGSS
jgi:hypothetical protein